LFCNVSLFCNKFCSYCYLPRNSRQDKYFIPIDELIKALLNFRKMNVEYVTLGGGEPSILDNFYTITKAISDLGFKLIVNTNGSLLRKHFLHLSKLNIVYISFSIDSLNSKLNDKYRFQGATDLVVEKIKEASSFKLPIRISTVVNKTNADEIHTLVTFAETMNVNLINIHNMELLDHQSNDVINKSLSPEEWIFRYKQWVTIAKESKVFIRAPISYLGLEYIKEIFIKNIYCPAKLSDTFNLFPSGKIYRCPFLVHEDIYAWDVNHQDMLVDLPKDNFFFKENNNIFGMCPVIFKRYNNCHNNLYPVCHFIKTTLNPIGGAKNEKWDEIVSSFINEYK
jgi:Fe-coproporphyrin III synthase